MNALRQYERPFRRDFSHLGFAVAAAMFVWVLFTNLLAVFARIFVPEIFGEWWTSLLFSDLPLYLLGLPAFALICFTVGQYPIERKPLGFGKWWLMLVVMLGTTFVGSQISNIITSVLDELLGSDTSDYIGRALSDFPVWGTFLFTVVLAPVVEELMFRQLLCSRLARYGDLTAIVFSAIAFGAFHGNFSQFFYAAPVGAVLAYTFLRTGRIRYSMMLHAASNFVTGVLPLAASRLIGGLSSDTEALTRALFTDPKVMLGVAISLLVSLIFLGCTAATVVILIVRRKHITFAAGEIRIPPNRVLPIEFCNPGVITMTVVFAAMFLLSVFG